MGGHSSTPENGQQKPHTLERGLDILMGLAAAREPMTVAELATSVNMPKSTVYRFLMVLRSYGLAEENERGRYHVGTRAMALGYAARRQVDLPRLCRPAMVELGNLTGESIILTVIRWPYGVCIDRVESLHPVRLTLEPGTVTGLHAGASCKVLLAFVDERLRERYLTEVNLHRYTDQTITSPDQLRQNLREIRTIGYSVSMDEVDLGSSAVAVPILGPDGEQVAGLSIAGPTFRIDARMVSKYLDHLLKTAEKLQELLAGQVVTQSTAG